MWRAITGAALACLAGCVTGPGSLPAESVPVEAFTSMAWPTLAEHCAGSGCHGTPDRPLALYARSEWRAQPEDLSLDPPLTDDELRHNAASSAAFVDREQPAGSALLLRPLHPDAGGSGHGGGAQFADAGDPDYAALLAWVNEVAR